MAMHGKFENRLGIAGWFLRGSWGIERYLYSLHRVTGLGILFYFLIHILVTGSRMLGKEVWEGVMGAVDSPVFHFGEFLVFIAFCFHAVNGIRLILIETGFAVGSPEEPVYPYRSSLNSQRLLMIAAVLAACILSLIGGYDLLFSNPHRGFSG